MKFFEIQKLLKTRKNVISHSLKKTITNNIESFNGTTDKNKRRIIKAKLNNIAIELKGINAIKTKTKITSLKKLKETVNKQKEIKEAKPINKKEQEREILEFKGMDNEVIEYEILYKDALKHYTRRRYEIITPKIQHIEKFYNTMKQIENHQELLGSEIILSYRSIEDNKIRYVTIASDYTNTYERFKERIEEMGEKNSDVEGSEPLYDDKYELIMNVFDLIFVSIEQIKGFGKSNKNLFKCEEIDSNSKNGLSCGNLCLKELGYELPNKNLIMLQDFISYVKTKDLDIDIINNAIEIKNANMIDFRTREFTEIVINKKRIALYKLDIKDITVNYLVGCGDNKNKVLFDKMDKHYSVIKGDKQLDDVYMRPNKEIYKKVKKINEKGEEYDDFLYIMNAKINYDLLESSKPIQIKYIFIDYETIVNFNNDNIMQDYSLSFMVCDDSDLENLLRDDNDEKIEKIDMKKYKIYNYVGFNNSVHLKDYIIKNQADTIFKIVTFNGSSFDNFILLNYLLKCDDDKISISDIFYNGNQLLNFKINGRHTMFDLHKHLTQGSLKEICENFKIKKCSKQSFDHNIAQNKYLDGTLINYMTGNKELIEYNNYDVISLACLFKKYSEVLKQIPIVKNNIFNDGLYFTDYITIGQIIFKIFKNECGKKKYEFGKLGEKEYTDLLKYKIAGRVEMFNNSQIIDDKVVSLDVCSEYPYVLAINNVYYPHGEIVHVEKYTKRDEIGFYYCDVDQSHLKRMNLPNIYAEKLENENDWGSTNILKDYLLSSVMIDYLLKYDCKVTIKNGFYFEKKAKSCEMFEFILDFMKMKNEQDSLSKVSSEKYNPSLRSFLKLAMNTVSGKIIEGLHVTATEAVDEMKYIKIKNSPTTDKITAINIIGDKIFTTYTKTIESKIQKQRPVYLGVLCYDYAKIHLYEHLLSKIGKDNLLYCDTDAGKFRHKHLDSYIKYANNITVPHWEEIEKIDERYKNHKIFESDSKVFGSFENELSNNNYFSCMQKKSWLCCDDNKVVKWSFKGISQRAILLTQEENDNLFKTNDEDVYKWIQKNNKRVLYDCKNKDATQLKELFNQLNNNKYAYLLCESFKKSVGNSKKACVEDIERHNKTNNTIKISYTIKKIIIRD